MTVWKPIELDQEKHEVTGLGEPMPRIQFTGQLGGEAVITLVVGWPSRKLASFRGSGTVWHNADTAARAPTRLEARLSEIWLKARWDRRESRVSEWRPIETAPKDGTPILVKEEIRLGSSAPKSAKAVAAWDPERKRWTTTYHSFVVLNATEWMPLPE